MKRYRVTMRDIYTSEESVCKVLAVNEEHASILAQVSHEWNWYIVFIEAIDE